MKEFATRFLGLDTGPFSHMIERRTITETYKDKTVTLHLGITKKDNSLLRVAFGCPEHPFEIMDGASLGTYDTAYKGALDQFESHLRYVHGGNEDTGDFLKHMRGIVVK